MAARQSWSCLPLAMVTLLGVISPCLSYSTGPPSSACTSMAPSHGSAPQQSSSPFAISVTATSYRPGQPLTVRLSSTGGRQFKGFLIKAVRAEIGTDQNQTLGTFSTSNLTKTACSSAQGSGLSHSDSSNKSSLDLEWTAPSTGQGNITFKATFVETKSTYWVAVPFPGVLTQETSETTAATTAASSVTSTSEMTPRPSSNTSFVLVAVSSPAALMLLEAASGHASRLPVTNLSHPVAIDWDPVEKEVYWTDAGRKEIRRYKLDLGRDEVVLQLNNAAVPDGLAVDSLSRLVIYTDTGNKVIAMVSMQGGYTKTILKRGLQEPRAVVVDPEQNLLYYTDWGFEPRIASLTYDGVQVTLVSSELRWPNGLALDKQGGWLYWVDASTDQVEAVRTQGGERRLLLWVPGRHHFGLTLLHGTLFLTDWLHSSVQTMDTTGGNMTYLGAAIEGRKNGIHAFSSLDSPSDASPCYGWFRGGCSNLCVVRKSRATCQCADGFSLLSDGYTCSQDETPSQSPPTTPTPSSNTPETTTAPWWSSIQSTTTTPQWWSTQTTTTTPRVMSTTTTPPGMSTTTTPRVMSTTSTPPGMSTTSTPPGMSTTTTPPGMPTTTTPRVMSITTTPPGISTTTTPPGMPTTTTPRVMSITTTPSGMSTTTTSPGMPTTTTPRVMSTTTTPSGMSTTTTSPGMSTTTTPRVMSTTTTPPGMPTTTTPPGMSTTTTPPGMSTTTTPRTTTTAGMSTTTTPGLTTRTTMTTTRTTISTMTTTTGMANTTTTGPPSTTVAAVVKPAPDTGSYVFLPCCALQWGFLPCLASDGSQTFVVC